MSSLQSTTLAADRQPHNSLLNGFGEYNQRADGVLSMLTDMKPDSSDLPLKSVTSRQSTESTWSTEANADEGAQYQDALSDPSIDEINKLGDTSSNNGFHCLESDLAFQTYLTAGCPSSSSKTVETNGSNNTFVADGRESVHTFESGAVASSFHSKANGECKPEDILAEDRTKFCGHSFVNSSTTDTPCTTEWENASSGVGLRLITPSNIIEWPLCHEESPPWPMWKPFDEVENGG
jgi:hypothetical protein